MLTIVNFEMGNIGSIYNMIKKLGFDAIISSGPNTLRKATKIILPGVGSFDQGIINLKKLNILETLNMKVLEEKTPILGICLGMQLMTKKSKEGTLEGLKWIDGYATDKTQEDLKIPHMGWNTIIHQKPSKIFDEIKTEKRFYFVHSYFVELSNYEEVLTSTYYGNNFVSSFEKNNIIGVQFHPEKSHNFGKALFKNFLERF